ncbi:MAG TPA: hypothetical protein DEA08_11935 [Planctomycetes bacterium]|nr:hypothetical protein [Planctomycetota bacterium]
MASVAYLALDESGREVSGTVEAPHRGAAAAQLRGQGLFPLELQELGSSGSDEREGLDLSCGFSTSGDRVLFLKQLGLMLRSGLTLLQGLDALARTGQRRGLREVAQRLSAAVQAGTPFSSALERERAFPALVAQLVRTAEATGELEVACQRAADYIDRRAALVYQLLSALCYPALVLLGACGVFWFMTTEVVPKFAAFLAGRGRTLPWTTQQLMDLSAFLVAHGATVLYGIAAALAALVLLWRTERGRAVLDRLLVRVPGLGHLLRTAAMAHLGHTLGMLLRSGLPLLEALRVLADSCGNRGYRAVFERAAERVVHGSSLAESVAHPTVTPLIQQLVGIGERSGSLDDVLEEAGRFYEERLQRLLRVLSGLVEPVVIVLVGGMVGFVYISFFQALFSLAR